MILVSGESGFAVQRTSILPRRTTGALTFPFVSLAFSLRVHAAARVAPVTLLEIATASTTRFGLRRFQTATNSKRRGAVWRAAGVSGVTL